MRIVVDDLSGPEVAALLSEHLDDMYETSPPESVHALDLERLRASDITFYTAWDGTELVGCGALKEVGPLHGEIKSMRTARAHLRRGVASEILSHLIGEARRRGYLALSLETGSGPAFTPALSLYEAFGFSYCGPFGPYDEDPFSRFMTLDLRPAPGDRRP